MYFSRGVFANIARGSLSIEGIPIESKQVVPKANNLENQTIFVQRHSTEEPQECLVIQTDDLLLQNTKTKRYFRAQRHELEYVNIPEQEGTQVTYVLKQQGKAILSYQIHGESHR
jgi:2-phospho-L-lactate guanylyltransferase (CobY/MobA/RfbA family)